MTWEEKLDAIQSVCEASLMMRKPGDWYVSWRAECKIYNQYGVLEGRYGNGTTPQEAVEDHWLQVTARDVEAVVTDALNERRQEVRWAGYMWRVVGPSRAAVEGQPCT